MIHRLAPSGRVLIERVLVVFGLVCLAYYGYQKADARHFQAEQTKAFEAVLQEAAFADADAVVAMPASGPAATVERVTPPEARSPLAKRRELPNPSASARTAAHASKLAGVFALLEIPRLKLSSPIVAGDQGAMLKVAVGHLPDTPKPWEPGNSAFAAHRDGLFRPLRNIRVGDEVRVRTERGDFVYRVNETKIVEPTDLSVLAPTITQTLTLITCYPFNLLGNAPQRFIVHAERLDPSQTAQ